MLKNKIALVTGGAAGIGRAICQQLGAEGASVAVVDFNREAGEECVAQLQESGAAGKIYRIGHGLAA